MEIQGNGHRRRCSAIKPKTYRFYITFYVNNANVNPSFAAQYDETTELALDIFRLSIFVCLFEVRITQHVFRTC